MLLVPGKTGTKLCSAIIVVSQPLARKDLCLKKKQVIMTPNRHWLVSISAWSVYTLGVVRANYGSYYEIDSSKTAEKKYCSKFCVVSAGDLPRWKEILLLFPGEGGGGGDDRAFSRGIIVLLIQIGKNMTMHGQNSALSHRSDK